MKLLARTGAACIPLVAMARLGPLRARQDVRVIVREIDAWVFWPAGEETVAALLLAIQGVTLFAEREGRWYAAGAALPAFNVPNKEDARPLLAFLSPEPIEPVEPGPLGLPVRVALVRDDRARATSALLASPTELARWADRALTCEMEGLTACRLEEGALLRGARLPALAGERFHGNRLLLPLGYRLEPDLPAEIVCSALQAEQGDFVLLTEEGADVLPAVAFGPVTRAGLRLAFQGGAS